jgi:prevent-host-death family protein
VTARKQGAFVPLIIKTSELKANCLALVNTVERTGQHFVITKNGRPVAELVPYHPRKRNKNACGILQDSLFITGDIISPIDVEWNALK